MSSNETNTWKEKYLRQLDELEQRERDWAALEKILRQSVSRLALAVETSDRLLGEQLESLRKAIRQNATASQIGALMEEISNSMLRLDQLQNHQTDALAERLAGLEERLEHLRPPAALKAPMQALRKGLRAARKEADPQQAVETMAAFMHALGEWLDDNSPESGREGLFGRLFNRQDNDASGSGEASVTAADETPEHSDLPATATSEPPGKGSGVDEAAAERGLDPRPEKTTADAKTDSEAPAFNQVLIDLVHRLDLPESLSAQVKTIVALLEQPPSPDTASRAIAEIADLMARARYHVEQEKKDIERFLSQLTGRLKELDRYLEESVGQREQSAREGLELDAQMSREVDGMRRSVSEAVDIHQLKQSIQEHLSNIQLHMDARTRLEHDRLRQAETEIEHLKVELTKVREEGLELRRRLREAHDRALRDALTGLYNRLAFDERIALECERWARYGRPSVLSVWDVDFFKRINDTYGHSAGDKVLRILAKLLSESTRKSDFLARIGGEEFILLLPETDIQTAFEVADKLRALVASSRFQYRGQPVPVTMSCGLAEFIPNDTPEEVYRRADAALYEAKGSGRNCCKVYDHSMHSHDAAEATAAAT